MSFMVLSKSPPQRVSFNQGVTFSFPTDANYKPAPVLAALLFGQIAATLLLGLYAAMVTTWLSFSWAEARKLERIFVGALTVGLLGGWIAGLVEVYQVLCAAFGDGIVLFDRAIGLPGPTQWGTLLFAIASIALSQFARRVFILYNRPIWLGWAFGLAIVFVSANGIALVPVFALIRATPFKFPLPPVRELVLLHYTSSAVLDVAIACAMVARLHRLRRKDTVQLATENLLLRLARLALASAGLTASIDVTFAALAIVPSPENPVAPAPIATAVLQGMLPVLPVVYALSSMFSLNSRHRLIVAASSISGSNTKLTRPGFGHKHSTSRSAASGIAISLHTMRHVDVAQQPELDLVSSLKTHPYLA